MRMPSGRRGKPLSKGEREKKKWQSARKGQRAQQMLEQINKRKKQIVLEVEDMYGAKSKKDKSHRRRMEYYEDEGNHRLVSAHGGISQAGGASGSSTAPAVTAPAVRHTPARPRPSTAPQGEAPTINLGNF